MNWSSLFHFSAAEWIAIRLSLKVAMWAVGTSLPFGVFLALVLARRRFWGREVLDVCVHLPLILPPVVTGYVLLLLFGKHGPLGRLLWKPWALLLLFAGQALRSPPR